MLFLYVCNTKDVYTKDVYTKDVYTKDVYAKDVYTKDLYTKDLYIQIHGNTNKPLIRFFKGLPIYFN